MTTNWKPIIRMGLLAGIITLYMAVVGMLESFSEREVIRDFVTLGQIMLVFASITAGYLATRRLSDAQNPLRLLVSGAIVGLMSSLPLLVLVLLASQLELRDILVNVTRDLIRILTFDQESLLTGGLMLLLVFTAAGTVGALIRSISPRLRQSLIFGVAWVLGIGILSELVQQILQQVFDRDALRVVFIRDALKPEAALAIFVIAAVLDYLWLSQGKVLRSRLTPTAPGPQRNLRYGGFALLALLLLVLPWLVGTATSDVLTSVGLYILMGLGLNIAVGLAGLLDLGYVTNFAVGAYVMGVLTSTGPLGIDAKTGLAIFNFWLVLPVSLIVAMFTGLILAVPVLRMRGDYLAIATLGFGEIIRLLAISDWLKPVIGGAQGILFIPKPEFLGVRLLPQAEIFPLILNDPQQIYYVILAACLFAIFVSTRLNNSRTGRQWMAIREDEDVAAAMGINTAKAKLLAFTLSAATGGLAGGIFASKLGTIFPNSFSLLVSVNVLSLIIIGGMGSIPGIVIGAFVLIGLPEILREFDQFRLLLYGALLIVMMLARPEGLWPSAIHRREMHQTEDDSKPIAEPPRDATVVVAGD
ncbi:MAG: branched-chain amino acid ABC transporter permease [Anaerolineae bacterium]|nr:branched-chain amino acid ABC transporter permease [Anaerolineae bacterium]